MNQTNEQNELDKCAKKYAMRGRSAKQDANIIFKNLAQLIDFIDVFNNFMGKQSDELLNLKNEIDDYKHCLGCQNELISNLAEDSKRYQIVRKLTPREFKEIYDINIKTGVHFDYLISQLIINSEPAYK